MLEYVGYTGIIRRVSLEADGKDIILVIPGDMKIFSSGFVVVEVKCRELEFRYMLCTLQGEAV